MKTTKIKLRDYQKKLVDAVKLACQSYQRVLAVSPTGSGKSVMIADLIDWALTQPRKTLITAPRAILVDQLSNTLTNFDLPHSFVATGRGHDPAAQVFVCGIEALRTRRVRLALGDDIDLVLVDEAAHSCATTWQEVIGSFELANVIGFTACPERLDGSGLGDVYQHMVMGPTTAELMARGHLSQYIAYAPVMPDLKGVRSQAGDYARGELEKRMDTPKLAGDMVKSWRERADGLLTMGFCVSVAHAQHCAEVFNAAGIPAVALHAATPRAEQDAAVGAFARKEVLAIFSCDLFSEGVDVASWSGMDVQVRCVMLLRPTKSLAMFLQQVGRLLRPSADGLPAILLDFAGNCQTHGLPDDERDYSLEGRKKQKEGDVNGPPPPRTCPGCFGQVRIGPSCCPYCGEVLAAPQELPKMLTKAELKEIKREEMEDRKKARAEAAAAKVAEADAIKRRNATRRIEDRACKTLEELIKLAGTRPDYKFPTAWAKQKWKSMGRH